MLSKLNVSLTCKLPPFNVIAAAFSALMTPKAASAWITTIPPLITVLPVKALFAVSVKVPVPDFVKLPLPVAMLELIVVLPAPPMLRLILLPPTAPVMAKLEPLLTLKLVALPKVIAVSLSPMVLTPPKVRPPFNVIAAGASTVNPLLKLKAPPLDPSVRFPVLLKVTAFVITPVVALSARL